MAYEDIPLWKWCARTKDFKPSYSTPDTPFGKRPIVMLTPHWVFDFTMPAKDMTERREVEALIHGYDGVPTFRVYDARVPFPAVFDAVTDRQLPAGGIPALTVVSMSKTTSSLTVRGLAGDYITWGDPIGFTHGSRRHYYKAKTSIRLTGGDDVLPVFIRPYVDADGDVAVDVEAERVRPTQAFNVRINDIPQRTDADHLTRFSVEGVEHWGGV